MTIAVESQFKQLRSSPKKGFCAGLTVLEPSELFSLAQSSQNKVTLVMLQIIVRKVFQGMFKSVFLKNKSLVNDFSRS